ncbi:hypothetical protein ONZ43_g904 [Nemania bipapillata]|uniref:Uncharacterized protein n=1 Tax=Nemania bipapillata TaxID=110536 RepID=A0ACC2J6C4_9PEZI|nr:hypothetical protein ONZ43_g904 [Nemania bipapillata]
MPSIVIHLLHLFAVGAAVLASASPILDQHPSSLGERANASGGISSDFFASLERLSRLVDIAYCVGTTGIRQPFSCISRCDDFPSLELVTTWNTGVLLSDSCGYVAIDHGTLPPTAEPNLLSAPHEKDRPNKKPGGVIIVAFRGTYSITNAVVDLSTVPQQYVPYPPADDEDDIPRKEPEQKCTNCTVHMGFLLSWQIARRTVLPELKRLHEQYPDYPIHVTGHSLGGAVGALAALEMKAVLEWEQVIVTTFGEPRVGNVGFTKYLDIAFGLQDEEKDAEQRAYRRITHIDDPVPLLPLSEWGYRSHAGEFFISKAELSPKPSDIRPCVGDYDLNCIAGSDGDEAESIGEAVPAKDSYNDGDAMSNGIWHLPARLKLWGLLFAHRDYFWRLGLCIPGGDPINWVYNVTKYLQDHPGGAELLVDVAGKDASEEFDNAGHSEDASEIMALYHVGKLQGGGKKMKRPTRLVTAVTAEKPSTAKSAMKTVASLGAATAVILSTVGLYHTANQRGLLAALPKLKLSMPSRTQGLGFLDGFLISTAVFGLASTVLSRRLLKLLHAHPTFMNYPPHVKLPKRVKPELLSQGGWLHPTTFQTLPLVKKDLVAPNTYCLVFELPTPQSVLGLPIGQHVAITAVVDGQAVTRSYTPVSNNADRGILELIIKCYSNGKLTGGYLANLEIGDEVKFRGPKGAMRYKRGHAKRIGMLAGGSGITPMYQLIRAICEDQRDTTEVSLIYANRTEEDILLRSELEAFARKYPKNFKLHYMLDSPPPEWQGGVGYVTKDIMAERFPAADSDSKVMLCGPPGMVNAAKKALVELGYEKPGAMSKMSDQIFCF